MILVDTETIGFVGAVSLIQYKKDKNQTILYNPWKNKVKTTIDLIEEFMDHVLVAFNFTFDSFHIAKLYNTFIQLPPNYPPVPIDAYVAERHAWKGKCLKPKGVIDLFLLLKDTNFQFLNKRKNVIIKSIPVQSSGWLNERLSSWDFNPLLFAKRKSGYKWNIIKNREGFVDFKLEFDPSSGLKPIVNWLFGIDVLDFGIKNFPAERCPFSKRSSSHYKPFDNGWLDYLPSHIKYWEGEGKPYALQDISCLKILQEWFAGNVQGTVDPDEIIDISSHFHKNSELAWQVGVVRQRGFSLNLPLIRSKLNKLLLQPSIPIAPRAALTYLLEVASSFEKIVIKNTDSDTLQELATLSSPIGERAKEIIEARTNEKKILLYRRLLDVGRFHPNFSVVGTFSNRMSGASGINPQGIDRKERDIFTFNDTILPVLSGGDFDSQELTIAAEVYSDLQLSDDIREGFDIHANSAKNLFPVSFCRICQGKVSDPPCAWCGGEAVIIPSTVTKEERYIGKNGFNFPLIYGAEPKSIHHNTHIDLEIVEYAFNKFFDRYKGAKSFRDKISKDFCSMVQPSGIGTEVIWNDPKEYIESLFGYKRYFDVENYITKQLFDLAQETRTRTRTSKVRVERKPGKLQTIWGATASSLYAAAFQIQAKNLRQSGNHVIQSTGAGITKNLQLAIWSIQPIGINDWKVCPYNVHDEIMVSNNCPDIVHLKVEESINEMKKVVPLLKMTWKETLQDWSKK